MVHIFQKKRPRGEKYSIGIVRSLFNAVITSGLLNGALKALKEAGVNADKIFILEVPGSFELPFGAKRLAGAKKCDAIICLGAIIKGETRQNEFIALATTQGIEHISLELNIPMLYGVITVPDLQKARERSGDTDSNRGYEAAKSAIELLENVDNLSSSEI